MSAPEVQTISDINLRRYATGMRLTVDAMIVVYTAELRVSERNPEKLTKSFVGMACTVWDRALSKPDIQAIVLQAEEYHSGRKFNNIAKLQAIVSKARTEANIGFCFNALHDLHLANLLSPADATQRKLEGYPKVDNGKGLVDLLCLKNRRRYNVPHGSCHSLSVL